MSFFGSLTGSSQRKDVKKAYNASTSMLNQGADSARNALGQYYGDAQGYIQPYLQGGAQANTLLGNYLGVNGADAQSQAFEGFQTDPGWMASQQAGIGALDRSAAARGGLYSGAQQKALYDYGQKNMLDAYNQRINALSGFAGQGQQAAGTAAGLAANQGNTLAGLEFGLGQQHASNRINYGNALSQTRSIGVNNLMNLAGTAAKAFAASDIRVKRGIQHIGALPSGLPVYRFKYLWDDAEHVGVMAQEAMQMFPDAVAEIDGVLHVDYNAIG